MEVLQKSLSKILMMVSVLLISTNKSNAQAHASASASVTIVTPVAITLDNNMDFGNVAVSASTPGTVVLGATGNRSNTGAVTLPANKGSVSAARFTVSGAEGYVYAITLPENCVLTDGNSHNMTINNFTSVPSGTGTLVGGVSTLKVGATLNVPAGQPAGAYTSPTGFAVTVNYN